MSQVINSSPLTDKFAKELKSFFEWASNNNYLIKDIDSEEHNWTIKLLFNFEEPGRNKLELYIKSLLNKYTISINDNDINDSKLLAKEFKENKPKKVTKKEISEEETPKKVTKKVTKKETTKKETPEETSEETPTKVTKKETPKKETKKETPKKETPKKETSVILDMSLDTSYTNELNTLKYCTDELVDVFGEPVKTGEKDDGHVYEWKIKINDSIYAIYDWYNEDNFENTTWYLAGEDESEHNIKTLYKYIDSKLKEQNDESDDEIKKQNEESYDESDDESDDEIKKQNEDEDSDELILSDIE